jgi:hypothetical protein
MWLVQALAYVKADSHQNVSPWTGIEDSNAKWVLEPPQLLDGYASIPWLRTDCCESDAFAE